MKNNLSSISLRRAVALTLPLFLFALILSSNNQSVDASKNNSTGNNAIESGLELPDLGIGASRAGSGLFPRIIRGIKTSLARLLTRIPIRLSAA